MPALLIAQPLNVATPAVAFFESPPLQVSVAPAVPVPATIERVTELVLTVDVLPPASWIATEGWVVNATPRAPPAGETVNPSFAAGPASTVSDWLVSDARSGDDAVSVYPEPTLSIVQALNVATPLAAATVGETQLSVAPATPVPAVKKAAPKK